MARSGSVELMFHLVEAADVEVRGDIARYTGGLGSSALTLRLSDVTDPGDPIDLISLGTGDVPSQCPTIPCSVPVDIDETLEPGDYVLFASVGVTGVNIFYPPLGYIAMGGGLSYVDVSMERFYVPEPTGFLPTAVALGTLAGLARRRAHGCDTLYTRRVDVDQPIAVAHRDLAPRRAPRWLSRPAYQPRSRS